MSGKESNLFSSIELYGAQRSFLPLILIKPRAAIILKNLLDIIWRNGYMSTEASKIKSVQRK